MTIDELEVDTRCAVLFDPFFVCFLTSLFGWFSQTGQKTEKANLNQKPELNTGSENSLKN